MKKLLTISGITFVSAWIPGCDRHQRPQAQRHRHRPRAYYAAHEHAAMLQTLCVDALAGLALIGLHSACPAPSPAPPGSASGSRLHRRRDVPVPSRHRRDPRHPRRRLRQPSLHARPLRHPQQRRHRQDRAARADRHHRLNRRPRAPSRAGSPPAESRSHRYSRSAALPSRSTATPCTAPSTSPSHCSCSGPQRSASS